MAVLLYAFHFGQIGERDCSRHLFAVNTLAMLLLTANVFSKQSNTCQACELQRMCQS